MIAAGAGTLASNWRGGSPIDVDVGGGLARRAGQLWEVFDMVLINGQRLDDGHRHGHAG